MRWQEWIYIGNPDNTKRRIIVLQAVASRKAGRWLSLDNAIEFMDGQRITAVYRPQPDTRDGEMEIDMALKNVWIGIGIRETYGVQQQRD